MQARHARAVAGLVITATFGVSLPAVAGSSAPTVTTDKWVLTDAETVEITGTIVNDGGDGIVSRGFCWDSFPGPNINTGTPVYSSDTTDTFTVSSSLGEGHKLYIRAFAQNGGDIGYGDQIVVFTGSTDDWSNMTREWSYNRVTTNYTEAATISSGGSQFIAASHGTRITETSTGWYDTSSSPKLSYDAWRRIAASDGGQYRLVGALTSNKDISCEGLLCVSVNDGDSYTLITPGGRDDEGWSDVAMSADGGVMYAATRETNEIYKSTDHGTNWAKVSPILGSGNLEALCASSDGRVVYAIQDTGFCLRSDSGGAPWTQLNVGGSGASGTFRDVACSADGQTVYVLRQAGSGALLYQSVNKGDSWTNRSPTGLSSLRAVSCSADGKHVILAADTVVLVSEDSGVTWTSQDVEHAPVNAVFTGVEMSLNGRTVLAFAEDGTMYTADFSRDPTVSTAEVANVTATSAKCAGTVVAGLDPVGIRGVCWSTTNPPAVEDNYKRIGEGEGAFSGTITDLEPNTTYYVRAFADRQASKALGVLRKGSGVQYGEVKSFTTLSGDSDGDGVPDGEDACPNDRHKTAEGACGCGVRDTDTDGDGVADCDDECADDPDKVAPGTCGCGVKDVDADEDGFVDCLDECADDPTKQDPGGCGCGVVDLDTDEDGVLDCHDACPEDPFKTEAGICGCGAEDFDTDEDGVEDCLDECPADPNKTEPGINGCGVSDDDDPDGRPDLEVTIQQEEREEGSPTPQIGEELKFRVKVRNIGQRTATGVVISIPLPEGTELVSAQIVEPTGQALPENMWVEDGVLYLNCGDVEITDDINVDLVLRATRSGEVSVTPEVASVEEPEPVAPEQPAVVIVNQEMDEEQVIVTTRGPASACGAVGMIPLGLLVSLFLVGTTKRRGR